MSPFTKYAESKAPISSEKRISSAEWTFRDFANDVVKTSAVTTLLNPDSIHIVEAKPREEYIGRSLEVHATTKEAASYHDEISRQNTMNQDLVQDLVWTGPKIEDIVTPQTIFKPSSTPVSSSRLDTLEHTELSLLQAVADGDKGRLKKALEREPSKEYVVFAFRKAYESGQKDMIAQFVTQMDKDFLSFLFHEALLAEHAVGIATLLPFIPSSRRDSGFFEALRTAFNYACRRGRKGMIEALASELDDDYLTTAFYEELEARREEVVKSLEQALTGGSKAAVDEPSPRKDAVTVELCFSVVSPNRKVDILFEAIEKGETDIVQICLDQLHMRPWPLLSRAALRGNVTILNIIIQHILSNKDVQVPVGYSALHLAAEEGSDSAVQLLIQEGHSTSAKDELGRTPMSLAQSNGHVHVAKILEGTGQITQETAGDTPQSRRRRTLRPRRV